MFSLLINKALVLTVVVLVINGCTPAKYKGWSGGDDYFDKNNKTKQKQLVKEDSKTKYKLTKTNPCPDVYLVKKGDTLSGISQRCSIKQATLVRINQLLPPFWLKVNQQIKLKPPKGFVEKQNPKNSFVWPLKNRVKKSRLSSYQFVDDASGLTSLTIKAPTGTAVYTVSAGEVVYSGEGIKHFGKLVIIKHDNGYLTLYAHNHALKVTEGQKVKSKQLIATVGNSGNVSKPQLYFEVRYRGIKVDAKENFKLRKL